MGHLLTMVLRCINFFLSFFFFFFLYIKNYSSVYKWMPALSNIENNLESVSQRGNRGQLNTPLHRRGQALR